MAFRWRADGGPRLNAGLVAAIFQGIRTCIAGKPYIFVIFQGGLEPPVPSLDPHIRLRFRLIVKMTMCHSGTFTFISQASSSFKLNGWPVIAL